MRITSIKCTKAAKKLKMPIATSKPEGLFLITKLAKLPPDAIKKKTTPKDPNTNI